VREGGRVTTPYQCKQRWLDKQGRRKKTLSAASLDCSKEITDNGGKLLNIQLCRNCLVKEKYRMSNYHQLRIMKVKYNEFP
jgi:hypothetical protein